MSLNTRPARAHIKKFAVVAALSAATPVISTAEQTAQQGTAQLIEAQYSDSESATQRIDLSGKLRMLSQRLVANACYVQAGILPNETIPALEATIAEFAQITRALEYGDPSIGIAAAEQRRKTLVDLGALNDLWAPMEVLAAKVANNQGTPEDVTVLTTQSIGLLDMAKRLVAEITAQYTNPAEMRQADAMVIGIAGRQRMLAQRVSKYACLTATNLGPNIVSTELTDTASAFNNSLTALYAGMPSMGIQAPPTPAIEEGLAQVRENWTGIQALVSIVAETGTLDTQQLEAMYRGANVLTAEMNKVVGLYANSAAAGNNS